MNNSTNNRWLLVVTLILVTANIVTLALLWTNKTGKGEKFPPLRQEQVFEFVSNELKLDSVQKEAYKKLRDEHQAGQKPLQDSIRKAKDALFSLLEQGNVADSMLQSYSKRAAEAEQQLDLLTFKHFQKLRAICDPEQQKKFDSIIKDVLRRMAPPKRQGPPPEREGDRPGREGPPPPREN